jgi:hypothetical protein
MVKVKMKQSHYQLGQALRVQEVDAPRLQDNPHIKVVRLSALITFRPYLPRKYSWYSFLLEAELTPVLQCGREDYVNGKFQGHHLESIPRPSGL